MGLLHDLGFSFVGPTDDAEGSPVARVIYLVLGLIAIYLLSRRRHLLGETARANWVLLVLFAYIGLSISWSDMPFISGKRYIKMVGALCMALLIVTERAPYTALVDLLKRYVWIVLLGSCFTIIFLPGVGREVHYDGSTSIAGICFGKNGLGQCTLLAMVLAAIPVIVRGRAGVTTGNIMLFMLALITLIFARSATSLVVASVIIGILLLVRSMSVFSPVYAGGVALFVIVLGIGSVFLAESMTPRLHIMQSAIEVLGRDSTLTGRTELWSDVWNIASERPLLGHGTGAFWAGNIGASRPILETYYWTPNQAHNGYLDVIADLGFVGLVLVIGVAIWGLFSAIYVLPEQFQYGLLKISLIIGALMLNLTESSFCRITHLIWMLTLFAIVQPPAQRQSGD